jgi:ATP adenylyltransferase
MDKIYAPWRHDYVSKTTKTGDRAKTKKECVFCKQFASKDDEKYLTIKRFKYSAIVMNYFPYNSGHLMVLPLEHKAELFELSSKVRAELMEATNVATEVLKKTMKPNGFNVGINIGFAGGGGLPSHLHIHILPRWDGDTNYLATIGNTKVICSDFKQVYKMLRKELEKTKI